MRRAGLATVIALFAFAALFPHAPSAAASARGSGHVAAREVAIPSGPASDPIDAGQLFDRVGVQWLSREEGLTVEVRTSLDGRSWTEWTAVVEDEDLEPPGTDEHWSATLAVGPARFAEYRVVGLADPSALGSVHLTFIDASDLNDPLARLAADVAGALQDMGNAYALAAPVGAPRILTRQDWGADESLMRWTPEYQRVQKAIIHHTATDDGGTNVAATIRAIYYYHAVTRGWGDVGYNYFADRYGNIWTGRAGGDNVIAGHAYGWNNGTIGIAAIGTYSTTSPTPSLVGAIENLIALKFSQFGIQPYGADSFTHQEERSDGTWVDVTTSPPNIQGHRDANDIVGQSGGQTDCPGGALYALLPAIRAAAQTAVTAGYSNLVRIEPALPKAGLPGAVLPVSTTVLNVGRTTIPAGTAVSYQVVSGANVVVAQGPQVQLALPLAPGATATVTVPFSVPPIGSYDLRWDLETGTAWWHALYAAPVRDLWFRSADWSADWVSDTVPRSWFPGQSATVSVTVTNDGGRVWNAAGIDPVALGYRWIDQANGVVTAGKNFSPLGADVQPGQTVTLFIPVTAPVVSSNYVMELDLYKTNEFWFKDKGIPADPTPIGVGLDFKASYQVGPLPALTAGQLGSVSVAVTNTGQSTFQALSTQPVDLGYHWYDQAGKLVVWDGLRTKLPADLRPGATAPLVAQVQSPGSGGSYSLRFDLAQEGVAWFSAKGVPGASVLASVCCVKAYGATYQPQVTALAVSGQAATVPIAVTNTSNFAWPAGGATPVHLGYHWIDASGTAVVWDGLRTALPADVPPGQTVALQANLQFPLASGGYTLRYDMVQEGVTWFSSQNVPPYSQPVSVGPSIQQTYAASIDATGLPSAMATRMVTTVALKVQNASSAAWGANVNLSYHWLDAQGNPVVWDGLRTSLAGVAPGQTITAYPRIAGPAAPGAYTLRLDIVQEGVAWFSSKGQSFPALAEQIVVPAYGATYTVPASIAGVAGTAVTLPLTLTNAGSVSWDPQQQFDLSYHLFDPAGVVVVWDGLRSALPGPVGPGQSLTLVATVQLPTSGLYALQFDLVQEGVTWFSGQGVPAESITLQVR